MVRTGDGSRAAITFGTLLIIISHSLPPFRVQVGRVVACRKTTSHTVSQVGGMGNMPPRSEEGMKKDSKFLMDDSQRENISFINFKNRFLTPRFPLGIHVELIEKIFKTKDVKFYRFIEQFF
ncbi:hypothetical protein CEXT_802061 [Caerostris extrusa]|uniref:Uncharacterized protein n=1 Tax=Caerostris extrusa TaxID=172846 RepID=A0AAV4N899_CAEEX|nr:hypothetical protein CEXT_802061 [Caerostris extrusa]